MIQGVIFDVDGTLLDSMPMWAMLCSDYVRSKGVDPEELLDQQISSYSFEEGVALLRDRYLPELTPELIRQEILDRIAYFYEEEVQAKPWALPVLESYDKQGIPMVIATSSDHALVEKAMKRLGLRHYFKEIFTCDELQMSKKTSDIYLYAASFLGTEPGNTQVYEDALYAVRSAKAGGFRVTGIADPVSAQDEMEIREFADDFISVREVSYLSGENK